MTASATEKFREHWTAIGLDCSECDHKKAEKAIRTIYKINDLEKPAFAWCRSPIEGVICLTLFNALHEVHKNTDKPYGFVPALAKLWNKNRFKHPRDVRDLITEWRDDKLENSWHKQLAEDMAKAASRLTPQGISYHEVLLSKLRSSDEKRKNASILVGNSFHGQHDWSIPYYKFPEDVHGYKYNAEDKKQLNHWCNVSVSCGWWSAFDFLAICMEKPMLQSLNSEGECHNDDGPAVAYGDGFSIYMINGTKVPKKVVMCPQEQTLEEINKEEDLDVRAIRIERYGWVNYLRDSNAKAIDERPNPVENTLEALVETERGERRLVVTCPTGRMHALSCPNTCNTCAEAQKWRAGQAAHMNILART